MRPPVTLPQGIAIKQEESAFTSFGHGAGQTPRPPVLITRRWLRGKHFVLVFIFPGLSAALGYWISQSGLNFLTGFAALSLLHFDYLILAAFLNRTTVQVGNGEVIVEHGPLPFPTAKRARFKKEELKQLYAADFRGRFAVNADLTSGKTIPLVPFLVSAEQALFIEQQIEQTLGIVDFEVPGELGSALPELLNQASGKPVAVKGAGSAVALGALMPLLFGGGLAFMIFTMMSTEVSGQLAATGKQGAFTFTPTDCRSGQRFGFFGVDLVNEEEQTVRVLQDPVQGPQLLLQVGNNPAQLAKLTGCATVNIQVRHTNTTINDVRVVAGSVNVDCPELKSQMTFDGCH
jgi:hypothetical protein